MNSALKEPQKKVYTYADYLEFEGAERYEIIDGKPRMLAAPSRRHQDMFRYLFLFLGNYFKDKPCKVYAAPFDVVLMKAEYEVNTSEPRDHRIDFVTWADEKDSIRVVQPDILVICDKSKLTDKGCTGAPDFIIEITSPTDRWYDYKDKLRLYGENGVLEYWIVDMEKQRVAQWILQDGRGYDVPNLFTMQDKVSAFIFKDCVIDFADIDIS